MAVVFLCGDVAVMGIGEDVAVVRAWSIFVYVSAYAYKINK